MDRHDTGFTCELDGTMSSIQEIVLYDMVLTVCAGLFKGGRPGPFVI